MYPSAFDRSGLAALSDLQTQEWRDSFSVLEKEQSAFRQMGNEILDPDYQWPRDPLYQFSRVWEYPYVYHHILQLKNKGLVPAGARVADLGSGVTFFPFSIARLGLDVTCVDSDIVCERNMLRAIKLFARDGMHIKFQLSPGSSIPLPGGSISILYCISVLEHVVQFEPLVDEIARVLAAGGYFLLTVDVDLLPDVDPKYKRFSELGIERLYKLMECLPKHFDFYYPQATVHPCDVLHSETGPYPIRNIQGMKLLGFCIKQSIKPLLGRKPSPAPKKLRLTVEGMALKKR